MKKTLQKYLLGIFMAAAAFSIATVSAQQAVGSACTNGSGQSGSWNGSICVGNAGGSSGQQNRSAQASNADLSVIADLIKQIQNIVGLLVPLAIGVAIAWFLFSLVRYVIAADKPDDRAKNLTGMIWSIIAIFIMVSIWGIIYFLNSATGINQGGQAQLPSVPVYKN